MMTQHKQKQKQNVPAVTVADHVRYLKLERAIDAMYDRADAYSATWSTEKTELEIELASLKAWIEDNDK